MPKSRSEVMEAVIRGAEEMVRERDADLEVAEDSPLADLGIDSLALVMLFVKLEETLGINLQELGSIDRDLHRIGDVAGLLSEKFGMEGAHP